MSLARLHRVEHARKAQGHCGACKKPIAKGDGYLWWTVGFRSRHKRVRCVGCGYPADSQRESNEQLAQLWDTRDAFYKCVDAATTVDDLTSACSEAADGVRDAIAGWEEKKSNLEQAFQGGCPQIEEIEEKISEAETLADALEGASFDESEDDGEPDDDGEPENLDDLREQARSLWDDNCNL